MVEIHDPRPWPPNGAYQLAAALVVLALLALALCALGGGA